MKKVLALILFSGLCTLVKAQSNEYLSAAEKYFSKGDYYSAAQYYEKYLGGGKGKGSSGFNPYAITAVSNKTSAPSSANKETVLYKVAESYSQLHFHSKAEPYYKMLLESGHNNYPLAGYKYATTLRALGKYEEAEAAFLDFQKNYSGADIYSENTAREINNLHYIKQQLGKNDLAAYTLSKAAGLSSEGGNYAPAWMNDNTLLFTSTRPGKDKGFVNRVYSADFSNGSPGNINTLAMQQPADMQQGVVAVSADENTIFLTRWVVGKGTKNSAIYVSRKTAGSWSDPVLAKNLNVPESNAQQPFIMPDGRHILFASDRPGGLGGYDLWVADLTNGEATNPKNMGSIINTKYDEQAPFYHAATNNLVFSSNGRTGMGGFDFFYTKGNLNQFAEPVNFGYPVNSIKDDIYFTTRKATSNLLEDVLISSDRDAACCLELFSLHKNKPLKMIEGSVVTCEGNLPLAGVTVNFVDPATNKIILEKVTDGSGNYSFTLEEYQLLKATASLTGYFTGSIRFNAPDAADADKLITPAICLKKIPEVAITVDNVYYDFNKATLQSTSFVSLDELVALLNDNPTMQIELSAHTDSKGTEEYNQKLSEARATSVVDYLISKGIDRTRLIAKGYGEMAPVANNTNADGSDNPEGRQKNRRTEFKVLKN